MCFKLAALVGLLTTAVLGAPQLVRAGPVSTTLYYTTYTVEQGDTVHKVNLSYTGNGTNGNGTFSLTNNTGVADTPGADGLLFAPSGRLLIGGQGPNIYSVNVSDGTHTTIATGGVDVYHLALAPNGTTVYGGGSEGDSQGVAVVNINSAATTGTGSTQTLTGSTNNAPLPKTITGIAFDANGNAFYTSNNDNGTGGQFGTISNLGGSGAANTVALDPNLVAAHGISYDSFTGDFILVGGDEIAQVSSTGQIISSRIFAGENFDQGSVDGNGHLFAASNTGNLVFIDYSSTGLVGSALNFTSTTFLNTDLDDVAPLSGLGAQAAPEPGTLTLAGMGIAGLFGYGWRNRKKVVV